MKDVDILGEGAEFSHVGIATRRISGHLVDGKVFDPLQNVSVGFSRLHGCPVELIEPADELSPVNEILKKGLGAYHLCFRVPDLEKAIQSAKKNGCVCFAKPVEAAAFGQKKVSWLYSKDFGILELIEK